MWLITRNLALAVAIVTIVPPSLALGQSLLASADSSSSESPFLTRHRILQASLERISRGSALWRDAAAAVQKAGRRVLLVTPADVVISSAGPGEAGETLEPGILAEAVPILGSDSRISVVVVVVNLRLVLEVHNAKFSVPRDFEGDLDRIVVHEVYGHAVPYLLAGDPSGRCADPTPGESASDACSIRRENAVRAELGLGLRADRGLSSLKLAVRGR